jgi:hypothetical protein
MKQFSKKSLLSTLLAIILFVACSKELSFETGAAGAVAAGTLKDTLGACQEIEVKGRYVTDSALTDSNYLLVKVNFTSAGRYKIKSDTINGMWFADSGFAATTGIQVLKVKGYGKPILPIEVTGFLTMANSFCSFSCRASVPGGSGGGGGNVLDSTFFPMTAGSFWAYDFFFNTNSTRTIDSLTVNAYGDSAIINGTTYNIFETSDGFEYYFRKDKRGNYFTYSTVDFDYVTIFDSVKDFIEYRFLTDTAKAGYTWESPEMDVKIDADWGKAKAVFTIMQRDGSYVAANQLFYKVITVKRTILFKPNTPSTIDYFKILEGNSYYAKDYGLLDQDIIFSASDNLKTTLKRFKVN